MYKSATLCFDLTVVSNALNLECQKVKKYCFIYTQQLCKIFVYSMHYFIYNCIKIIKQNKGKI